jgi:hypothetical protein
MGCLSFRARSPPPAVAEQADWSPEVSAPVCVVQSLVDKLSVLKIASPSTTASPPPSGGGVCSKRSSGERPVNIAAAAAACGSPEDVVTVAFAGPGPEPVWEN